MIAETGATEGWAAFNVAFGASLLREAASMTTQISGEAFLLIFRTTWPCQILSLMAFALESLRGTPR